MTACGWLVGPTSGAFAPLRPLRPGRLPIPPAPSPLVSGTLPRTSVAPPLTYGAARGYKGTDETSSASMVAEFSDF